MKHFKFETKLLAGVLMILFLAFGLVQSAGAQEIIVTSPVGGEEWVVGNTKTIEWISSGAGDQVEIAVGHFVGCNFVYGDPIVTTSNTEGYNSYNWTVEGPAFYNCKVKVCSPTIAQPDICGQSEYFDIVVKRALSITQAIGNGAVSVDGSLPPYTLPWSGEFNENDSVTLEAIPDSFSGWEFYGWYGDLTGSVNPTTITMDGDKSITAIFYHQGNNILIIERIANGTVEVDGIGMSTFPYFGEFSASSLVSLNAVPDSGWVFSGWTGDLTGSTNPTAITMDSDKNITSNFAELPCTDNDGDGYFIEGGICGSVDCDDSNTSINPGANEVCNGVDDNCDSSIDEENASGCTTYYLDADGDSYGLTSDSKCLCAPSPPYSATQGNDCNDSNASINPGAGEIQCNGIDEDCDGVSECIQCIDGSCCFDTDGGINSAARGTVDGVLNGGGSGQPTDYCSGNYLIEYYCQVTSSNEIRYNSTSIYCPSGCGNGRCN